MGKILAQGRGVFDMMNKSSKLGLSKENSILEIDDETDLNSKWRIRAK